MKYIKLVGTHTEFESMELDTPWVVYDKEHVHYMNKDIVEISFTFGSVEDHSKAKSDAVVGDICYYGETPIGIVVIKGEETMKIMSLTHINENGNGSFEHNVEMEWGEFGATTGIIDQNNGKENTKALVALGSEYKAANACSLYATEGTKQGDWYLPALQELTDMNWGENYDLWQTSLNSLGSYAYPFRESSFWSSTEINKYTVGYINMDRAWFNIDEYDKDAPCAVRAFYEL